MKKPHKATFKIRKPPNRLSLTRQLRLRVPSVLEDGLESFYRRPSKDKGGTKLQKLCYRGQFNM